MMLPSLLPVPLDFLSCSDSLWSTVLNGFVSRDAFPVAGTHVTVWYLCCPVLSVHGLRVWKLLQPTDLPSPLPLELFQLYRPLFKVEASVVVLWTPQQPATSCSLILWAFYFLSLLTGISHHTLI